MNDNQNQNKSSHEIPPQYFSDAGVIDLDRMITDVIAVTKIGGFTQGALTDRIETVWPTVEVFSRPVGNA